jgi:hypothetical protein
MAYALSMGRTPLAPVSVGNEDITRQLPNECEHRLLLAEGWGGVVQGGPYARNAKRMAVVIDDSVHPFLRGIGGTT